MKRYAFEPFREGLKEVMELSGNQAVRRAYSRLMFSVAAVAWCECDAWHPDADEDQVFGWAWEDLRIAFSGYGDLGMEGDVLHFWNTMGEEFWDEALDILELAAADAERQTSRSVKRRYLKAYRNSPIRKPSDGYDLPSLIPVNGYRMRAWAESNGMVPEEAEEQMALMEEYERMGMIDLAINRSFIGHGGEEVEADSSVCREVEGAPFLTLVKR